MNMLKRILPAAAGLALFAAPGLAAVQGSHHDLSTWSGGTTQEVCLYCHGVTSTVTNTTDYGAIGDLCVSRCHRGAAGFAGSDAAIPNRPSFMTEGGVKIDHVATLDAVNVNNGFGHGLARADLRDPFGGATAETFDTVGQTLPYTSGPTMECTSCHNVHDYTYTPFLQRNLFTGNSAARPSFCEACHSTRGNSWAAAGEQPPNGEHPTNFGLVLGDSGRTNAERIWRFIALDDASDATAGDGNVFDQATPNGNALSASTTNFLTGGHVSGWGNAAAGLTFSCYTCHSAHMDNNGPGNTPNLILSNAYSVSGEWNPYCVSCHGDVANGLDDPNPGQSTSGFYHPAGSTANAQVSLAGNVAQFNASTGAFQFGVDLTVIRTLGPQGALADGICGIDGGTNGGDATVTSKPRCTSCHDVHGGINNSQALIDFDGTRDGVYAGQWCEACHTGADLVDLPDDRGQAGEQRGASATAGSHHRTRIATWAAGTITDADGNPLVMDAPSWTGATTANGLSCPDCHVFSNDTHKTAHNW